MHSLHRHRRILLILGLCLALCLLAVAVTWAAGGKTPPAPSSWLWGIVTGLVVLLLGVCSYFTRRYIERRDKQEERLIGRLDALDARLDNLERGQARIDERIAALPCRHSPGGNGIPPGPVCSLKDIDPVSP